MKSLELHLHSGREEESIIVTSLILQLMVTYQYPQLAAFLVVAYSWVDSFCLKVTKRGNFSNYELFSLDTGLFLMFMSWVSKDPWGLLLGEGHTRRGLAMGRMGITNAIMLLQAIFLYMLQAMIQQMQWAKYHFMLTSPTGFFCAFGFSTLDAAMWKIDFATVHGGDLMIWTMLIIFPRILHIQTMGWKRNHQV